MPPVLVRREASGDAGGIGRVHAAAFAEPGSPHEPVEVALVERLRASAAWLPRLSLVAAVDDAVVGHVVCSRAAVGDDDAPVLGLGPLAVLPRWQGQGVGSALMHAVLGAADALDESLVGLLGDPSYYGRFGFLPAEHLAISAPDESWGASFQVRRLTGYTPALRGRFRYAAPFAGV